MISREQESEALHARVRGFISGVSDETFDALACDLASFQARYIEPIARLAGVALPTDAFRLRRIAAHPESEDERCFMTSGTTQSLAGKHPMRTTATYRLAALTWARARLFPPKGARLVALVASEKQAPHSSLSFMLARFAEELLGGASWHYDGERLDVDGVVRACRAGQPVLVAGTSFAFVHLLDALGDTTLPLPPESRVMHTGGFKGRSRSVEPAALRAALARTFGLVPEFVIGEYGMTELSSQLYQHGSAYYGPPWMRVSAVDPESLAPVTGEGLARIVDLANVDSAVAIQTSDVVRVAPDGGVELLGRAPGATPRGCSLALEHLL